MTMLRLIAVTLLIGASLVLPRHAKAEGLTRVCVPWFDANNGQLNCVETGWLPKLLNGLTATVTSVKNSNHGQLGALYCYNPNASVAYLQVFDAATTSAVTLGTTTPKLSFGFAATSGQTIPVGTMGIYFANGIQVAAATTATGSSAPGSAMDCNATYE
jgi:hypothetical protein